MDLDLSPRQLLFTVLSFVVTIFAVLVVIVVFLLIQKPKVKHVWKEAESQAEIVKKRKKGKWEGKEKSAIRLVQKFNIPNPEFDPDPKRKNKDEEEVIPEEITLKALVTDKFFEKKYKLSNIEFLGWEAQYLKKSYYFVSYAHRDGLINVGPTWLVDVKKKRIIPKNAMAHAGMNPGKTNTKEFYEREQQVVSSISNHRFETGGVSLGGSMLIYFSNLDQTKKTAEVPGDNASNRILGWTVVHEYGDIYRAYFQWIEEDESTYAEFEFDYAKKALRSRNLQAANLMQFGQSFETTERVSILPLSYNPEAPVSTDRWLGPVRKACKSPKNRARCRVMDEIYQNKELIEAVEWLLTASSDTAAQFETCKKTRHCCWKTSAKTDGTYRVVYGYDLEAASNIKPNAEPDRECKAADGDNTVSWFVNPKTNAIVPENKISDMAYRAVRPRSQISL